MTKGGFAVPGSKAKQSEGRLWVRLIKKHRVAKSAVAPCRRDDPQEALRQILPGLDLSQPLWLPRHQADWDEYALTRFNAGDFIDVFPYDSMELSYIYPEDEKRPARRRNPAEEA